MVLGRIGQQSRDGLGKIADRVVAGIEEPIRQAGHFGGCAAQYLGGHDLARLAAGQHIHRPGCIGGGCIAQVMRERLELA